MIQHDKDKGRIRKNGPPQALWAYGYELTPPVARDRLTEVQIILDAGHTEARTKSEVWEGRFVNGDQITHILVVSDTAAQDADINRRLEAELTRLAAAFSVSVPVEVARDSRRRPGGGRSGPDADA